MLKYSSWVWDSKTLKASCYLWIQGRFLPHGTAVVPAPDGIDDGGPIPWVLSSVQQIKDCLSVEVHGVIQIGSLGSDLCHRDRGMELATGVLIYVTGQITGVRKWRRIKEKASGRNEEKQIITLTL
jgi:hypothetical protein